MTFLANQLTRSRGKVTYLLGDTKGILGFNNNTNCLEEADVDSETGLWSPYDFSPQNRDVFSNSRVPAKEKQRSGKKSLSSQPGRVCVNARHGRTQEKPQPSWTSISSSVELGKDYRFAR